MPDLICIQSGLAQKHWPEAGQMTLTTKKRACFQTGSVWPKPDTVSQNQTDSSLVLHNVIQTICGRKQLNLKVGTWWQAGSVLPDTGPNNFCTLAFFRTRCIWPRPDQAIKIGSRSFLHNMVQAFFGKMEPNQIQEAGSGIYAIWPNSCCNLAIMAITVRNQNASESDLACLLGGTC